MPVSQSYFANRIVGSTAQTIAILFWRQVRFEDRIQHQNCGCLDHAVLDCREMFSYRAVFLRQKLPIDHPGPFRHQPRVVVGADSLLPFRTQATSQSLVRQ